ncbi:MAG: hypothetical protein U0835_10085 [Isosphaeraceae bacterium]
MSADSDAGDGHGRHTRRRKSAWWKTAERYIWDNARGFLATLLVGILAALSGQIIENVKFRLNRADLRIERYQSLASELSAFAFSVELTQEFLEHNWTSLSTLKWLIPEYNNAITSLRKNEFVYRQWLSHYWGKQQVDAFNRIIDTAKKIDRTVHGLNDELEKVENDNACHPKVDESRARATAAELKPLAEELARSTAAFLDGLQ